MSKNLEKRYFILLSKSEIIFFCSNNKNKIFFKKKYDLINYDPNNLFVELQSFLNDNLIKIEKDLNVFIRKIYFIVDLENSLSVNLSIKHEFESEKNNQYIINDLLNLLKNQFIKHNNDQKIVHMIISKILIDGKEIDLSSIDKKFQKLILEVQFECLKDQTLILLKKIMSKYQISIEKILLNKHLKKFSKNYATDIIYSANKIIDGEFKNEVISIRKKNINIGFFEKFFHFFG